MVTAAAFPDARIVDNSAAIAAASAALVSAASASAVICSRTRSTPRRRLVTPWPMRGPQLHGWVQGVSLVNVQTTQEATAPAVAESVASPTMTAATTPPGDFL